MLLHGRFGDAQPDADLPVLHAIDEFQVKDLAASGRERGDDLFDQVPDFQGKDLRFFVRQAETAGVQPFRIVEEPLVGGEPQVDGPGTLEVVQAFVARNGEKKFLDAFFVFPLIAGHQFDKRILHDVKAFLLVAGETRDKVQQPWLVIQVQMGQVGHKTSPKNGGKISKKSVICKKDGANSPFGSGWTPSSRPPRPDKIGKSAGMCYLCIPK